MNKSFIYPVILCMLVIRFVPDCFAVDTDPNTERIVAAGATLVDITTGCKFTEGPAVDAKGNVYFTDQPNDRIMLYKTDGTLETFMQPCGRSNGMYFDRQGFLIACADEKNELWRINVKTKTHTVLVKSFQGNLLNAPNDVWIRPDGGIYFTDPFYKRSWWKRDPQSQQSCQGVYFFDPTDGQLVRVADDFVKPNGLIGTADGRTLYIADIQDKKIWRYTINTDGRLTDKTLFCHSGSDGMTIDCRGNVYLTNEQGVLVYNPEGNQIEQIKIPQRKTANVCFGGKDMKTLFITAQNGVYKIRMNVRGAFAL